MTEIRDVYEVIDDIFELGKDDGVAALKVLLDNGSIDGDHHKMWVIDQAVRHLAGPFYDELIAAYNNGEDGPDTYEWDVGIPP